MLHCPHCTGPQPEQIPVYIVIESRWTCVSRYHQDFNGGFTGIRGVYFDKAAAEKRLMECPPKPPEALERFVDEGVSFVEWEIIETASNSDKFLEW